MKIPHLSVQRSSQQPVCTTPYGPVLAALAMLFVLLVATPPQEASADVLDDVDASVGFMAHFGGNFLGQPSDRSATPGSPVELAYPGFAGTAGGGGLAVDVRYRKYLGLEMNLFFSSDEGSGFIDLVQITIGQTAWHLPVLFKLLYPGETFTPSIALGIEGVFPSKLIIETDPLLPNTATRVGAQAGAYTLVVAGVGLEIALPTRKIDLRIPINIRGGINPSTPDVTRGLAAYTFRANTDPIVADSVVFLSEWQYQLYITTGLSFHF